MPLRKVHEPTFLWFGLPGPLLIEGAFLWVLDGGGALRRVLRRGSSETRLFERTIPFACALVQQVLNVGA